MSSPPPLPWSARTTPERTILLAAVAAAVAALFWMAWGALHFPAWHCGWKEFTGLPCAGCGGTRALLLLVRGDWGTALLMNPGVALAAVLGAAVSLYAAGVVFLKLPPWRPSWAARFRWRWLALAAVVANWIYLLAAGRA